MKRLLIPILLLASFTVSGRDAPQFDPAGNPAKLASTFLKAGKLSALGNVKRVAIANFRVEFVVENSGKAHSSGSGGWTSSRADIKLLGIDDTMRQAIVDQLYDKLVQDLTDAGVEVVPYETLRETDSYKSMASIMRTGQEPLGVQGGKSVFLGAHGMPIYLTNDDKHLGLGTALGGFSTTQPQNIEPRIAEALDAAVLRATMAVSFADMATSGGLFRSGSSVKTNVGLAFAPELTQYLFVVPHSGKVRITLDDAVVMPEGGLTLEDVTTKKEKTAQAVGNVIGGLLGSGGGSTSRHLTATAKPQAYSGAIILYGGALESAMISLVRTALPGGGASKN